MWSDDEDAVAVPPRPLQQPARMPQLPAVAQAGQRVALVAQAGQQVAAAAHPGQRVPDWLLSSDSEEDEARPPAQRHARVPQQPAVAQARQPVAAVAQARQPVAAAALAAAPRIAQQPALQLEAEAAPAAGAQPKPLSALAAHAEAVKQGKAEAEASQKRRELYKDQSLLEQFRPEQPPSQAHAEGPEPAAWVGATAVVPPTSGPRAAAGAQSAGAQRTGAQRAGAQPTTAHPAAAQPEKAQLQRAQLLEERPMRGPPRDEQFAASPLAIGTVGLSLNEALAAKRAEQIGQPAAARSGVELLAHKLTYGQQADSVESKKVPLTSRTEMSSRNDRQRVALDDVHKAQAGTEHASFSPPTLIALCLQAVRDEPRLHAAVASWDRRDGGHDEDLQKLCLVLDEHMDKYRQLRGRLLVPYTINRYLFDYQREGVRFLADIYTGRRHAPGEEIKGGILADEMGLGKTIQVIGELRLRGSGERGTD
jgi:hypothetical protein